MFIDDRNEENYVDIYPFIDDTKDAGPSARIMSFEIFCEWLQAHDPRYRNGCRKSDAEIVQSFWDARYGKPCITWPMPVMRERSELEKLFMIAEKE